MPKYGKTVVLSAALLTAVAGAASAQGDCTIDEQSPISVGRAVIALNLASSATGEGATRQLASAVKSLTEDASGRNPVGKAFVLAKALTGWLAQPGQPVVTTRGQVGFTSATSDSIDLSVTIDSLFTAVETAVPQCSEITDQWRRSPGWIALLNRSIELINSDSTDAAERLAGQALRLSKAAPYPYLVMGHVATRRDKPKEAIQFYKSAAQTAGSDTLYRDVKRQILQTIGQVAVNAAQTDSAQKSAYLTEAKAAYDELLKDAGNYGDAARAGLAQIATVQGDTAAIRATYQEQLNNPSAFGFSSLVAAGVAAANINQVADATKIFESAVAANPFHRDGLYNLARLLVIGEQNDKALEILERLEKVDPSNPDTYYLYANVYAAKQRATVAQNRALGQRANATTNAARKRAMIDSSAALSKQEQALLKQALDMQNKAQDMPVKVTFNEFTPAEGKVTLGGTIANRTDAPKSYTLKVEFLDKAGTVVSTGEAAVGPVEPQRTGQFSIVGTGAGIVAFRYAPIH